MGADSRRGLFEEGLNQGEGAKSRIYELFVWAQAFKITNFES